MKKRKPKSSQPSSSRDKAPKAPAPVSKPRRSPAPIPAKAAPVVEIEDREPTVRRGTPLPVTLIAILGALLYLGDLYLINTAGQFDARVYYPYQSAEQLAEMRPKSDADAALAQGKKVYNYICVQCHQANGQGNPAMFIPPLAGSEWVLAPEPGRLIRIVYKGLEGPITVSGANYGQAAMFAVGDQLPGDDDEKIQQVAAVLTYIRNNWGNQAPPVTVERVKASQEKFKSRATPWTAAELLQIPESD